jgi:hypothetical protein
LLNAGEKEKDGEMSNKSIIVLRIIGWTELIIGGFGCLFTAWLTFILILYLRGGRMPYDDCGLGGLVYIFIPLTLAISIFTFLGIGVLKLRHWARIANIIVFSILLAVGLPFIIFLLFANNSDYLWFITLVVISSGEIWFFTRSKIKEQFK